MATNLNFSNINYNKSAEELGFKTASYISDLTFFKTEIEFLKKILNTFPFSSNPRNLFENIQIYTQNLDNSESERSQILKKIIPIKQQNLKSSKKDYLKNHSKFIDKFNNLEDEILTFITNYKNLKNSIYNFVYPLLLN